MTQTPEIPSPPLGLLSRAVGVVTSPAATFRSVVAHPRPVGILFLVCLAMVLATGLPQFTERGRTGALEMQLQQTQQFSGQPVTPEARQAMEQMSHYSGYLTLGSVFVFLPVVTILIGGFYWLVFNVILGGTAEFKQVLAVVTHSQVIAAVGAVLAAPIQYAQGVYTATGPFHLGALAAALPPTHALARLLGALTIVGFWQAVVTGLGLAVLYRRRSTGIVVALLIIYVSLTAFFYVVLPSLLPSAAGTR